MTEPEMKNPREDIDGEWEWNINLWLVTNLLPMFQKLKNKRLGVPYSMYGRSTFSGFEPSADESELAEERWDNILSEIIHGLECAKEVQDGKVRCSEMDAAPIERAFNLIGQHLFDLVD